MSEADLFVAVAERFAARSEYFQAGVLSRLGLRRLGEADDDHLALITRLLDEHDKRRGGAAEPVMERRWDTLGAAADERARLAALT